MLCDDERTKEYEEFRQTIRLDHETRTYVIGLTSRLSKWNPVRTFAERLLDSGDEPLPDIFRLLESVNDPAPWRYNERELAIWALGITPLLPENSRIAVETLADLIADPDPFRKWRSFFEWVQAISLTGLGAASVLSAAYGVQPGTAMINAILVGSGILLAFVMLPSKLLARRLLSDTGPYHRLRARAASALGRRRNINGTFPLAEALFDQKEVVREAGAAAFVDAGLHIDLDQEEQPNNKTVPALCRSLTHLDEAVILAGLEFLEAIGDGRAVGLWQSWQGMLRPS